MRSTIVGAPGLPPKLAVPDFIALSSDAETVAAAKTIGQVLWDDLNFEREFYLIPRDTYRTIPQPASLDQVPLDRWKELGADGVLVGHGPRRRQRRIVQVRLIKVSDRPVGDGQGIQRRASIANPRLYAHTIADEIHQQQRSAAAASRGRSWRSRPIATASG